MVISMRGLFTSWPPAIFLCFILLVLNHQHGHKSAVDAIKLMIFPNVTKIFRFANDDYYIGNSRLVWYTVNEDMFETARRICHDNGIVTGAPYQSLLRCYFAVTRTLLKQRVLTANAHVSMWKTRLSSLQVLKSANMVNVPYMNASFPDLFHWDGLLYSFVSGIDWAYRQDDKRRQQQSNAFIESESEPEHKQICIIGGPFCPDLAYGAALSIPSHLDYEILYVLSDDAKAACGISTGTLNDDVPLAKMMISQLYGQLLNDVYNPDRDPNTPQELIKELDIEVVSELQFIQQLLSRNKHTTQDNNNNDVNDDNEFHISCDIIYYRGNSASYLDTLLSLLHQYRAANRATHTQVPNTVNSNSNNVDYDIDEVAVVRESFISVLEEITKERKPEDDCRLDRIVASLNAFPSPLSASTASTASNASPYESVGSREKGNVCDRLLQSQRRKHFYRADGTFGSESSFLPVCT
jgi:hypothetical protein